ncbi:unnamed protein product [Allacma fusca]|uniref:Glycoside hydrolase 35 catalytic domain-containing protein n=1 Tax=Allacma fusca TaxID=39272 RepID=A0A8J2PC28_9HEXA|nr:unnamed protein product [Allacma fusca]
MGGLPPWLLWQSSTMRVRTTHPDFVYYVSNWFGVLLTKLKPYLYKNGGPIIMVQVENEYGSFGCDPDYKTFLRDLMQFHLGDDVVLFTTDNAIESKLKCGSIPSVYPTVDFGPGRNLH